MLVCNCKMSTVYNNYNFAVIEGPGKLNVADAKRRVEIIVWTNREKERPTHFISIPLTSPHIRDRVAQFNSAVLDSCQRVCYSRTSVMYSGVWFSGKRDL